MSGDLENECFVSPNAFTFNKVLIDQLEWASVQIDKQRLEITNLRVECAKAQLSLMEAYREIDYLLGKRKKPLPDSAKLDTVQRYYVQVWLDSHQAGATKRSACEALDQ
jgi:hypothetical protein